MRKSTVSLERLLFFGTPKFALPTLEALVSAGRRPVRVITQPPRPAGRGRQTQEPPVAVWTREHDIQVGQPEKVKDPAFLEEIAPLRPDVAVVVAFGQIFPPALLQLPRFGCINLHASLLPRYRGAAPVPAALAAGETMTGVTTMVMEEGLDTGPILLQDETEIGASETSGELSRRLAQLGARLVLRTLEGLEAGTIEPRPQVEGEASHAPRLQKEDGVVDWSWDATQLFNLLRAYTPWPGLTTQYRDRPLKLIWGRPLGGGEPLVGDPGSYLGLHEDCLAVGCGGDSVFGIERVQRPGKAILDAQDFANGERLKVGERFG